MNGQGISQIVVYSLALVGFGYPLGASGFGLPVGTLRIPKPNGCIELAKFVNTIYSLGTHGWGWVWWHSNTCSDVMGMRNVSQRHTLPAPVGARFIRLSKTKLFSPTVLRAFLYCSLISL